MDIEIKIGATVPDEERAADIVQVLERVIPFMADNVTIERQDCETDEPEDITKTKAERLVNACNGLGLAATLHWDRSPWCARVALVPIALTGWRDDTPSLFVFVEDADSSRILTQERTTGGLRGWRWHSQIQLEQGASLDDVNVEFLERDWLGESEHNVAQSIAQLAALIQIH
jgi:hypothetical protein